MVIPAGGQGECGRIGVGRGTGGEGIIEQEVSWEVGEIVENPQSQSQSKRV